MTLTTIEASGSRYALRRAERDDVEAILELLAGDVLRREESRSDDAAALRAFDVIDADASQLLVVVEGPGGAIVGTMQLSFIPGLSRGGATRMQIEAVRVDEALRGGGIGAAMIEWAIGCARERGARLVQLTSDARRDAAHRFYERLGFEASHVGFKLAL
ncbi:GNAT family N-acetyltransferase [Agromyces mediolanus]|uniref:GNAT family N-acetyltransferase n=1 Tax=Agromyces mediolanus TaxID=41986 RepID=UPI001E5A62FB|nr:GNAT family N-acetyltransferase [Agromyces mediolanus]MCD1570777.1 GNAT family N-acetyltransferase [Agromyces mediolanus]